MHRPTTPPKTGNTEAWQQYALEYLRSELKTAAPEHFDAMHLCPESPLEAEGAILALAFNADFGTGVPQRHWVLVGATEPNYYPYYDLDPADVFSLHWGTRFMSVLNVSQCEPERTDTYDAAQDARDILNRVAPRKPIEQVDVAVTFNVEDEKHTVLKCRLDDETIYIFGRDAPPGFSRRVDLSPRVAYRIHLGRVLMQEPNPTDDLSEG